MTIKEDLQDIRNLLIVLLVPVVLLPLALCFEGKESSCAYVMMIMAVFWLTEALPISVTALLPVFMFPLSGVMSAADTAAAFFNSTSLMFIGGMSVAVAIEEWKIHRRLALKILLGLGTRPAWLMLGLMMTSWFLSMWISNTATTAMMLPIASAIFDQLKKNACQSQDDETDASIKLTAIENPVDDVTVEIVVNGNRQEQMVSETEESATNDRNNNEVIWKHINTGFCLCIAYAANIGGTGSLTGTVSNLVLRGLLDDVYKNQGDESPITFGTWLAFAAPTSLVILVISWLWLQAYFLRSRGLFTCFRRSRDTSNGADIKAVLQKQYRKLGTISFGQIAVCCHFVALAFLWITRDLGGQFGWGPLFKDKYAMMIPTKRKCFTAWSVGVTTVILGSAHQLSVRFMKDSVPGILIMCLLFIFPSTVPRVFCFRNHASTSTPVQPLLSWQQFNQKMPWGVVFLVGGGFAMAKASQVSGLSAWIGYQLEHLDHLQPWVLMLVLCIVVALATEVTSNAATVSLILPVLADLATTLGLKPVYLMLPATIAASFAFMLPVATPANAIVFAYGDLKIIDMVKAGAPLNIIGIIVLMISMHTLGDALF